MKNAKQALRCRFVYVIEDQTPIVLKEKKIYIEHVNHLYSTGINLRFYNDKWRLKQRETVRICLAVPFLSYVCRPNLGIHKHVTMFRDHVTMFRDHATMFRDQCFINRFT